MELKAKNMFIGRLFTATDIEQNPETSKNEVTSKQGELAVLLKYNKDYLYYDDNRHRSAIIKDVNKAKKVGQIGYKPEIMIGLCDYLEYDKEDLIDLPEMTKIQDDLRSADKERKEKMEQRKLREQEQERDM